LRERILAAETLGTDDALERVSRFVSWLQAEPEVAVDGVIRPIAETAARIERLYLDAPPRAAGWAALTVGAEMTLPLGPQWVVQIDAKSS